MILLFTFRCTAVRVALRLMHKIINPLLICQFVFSSFCKMYTAAHTHYAIWSELCIISQFGAWLLLKRKIITFSIFRKIWNSQRIIMFLLFPVVAAAIFSIVLYSFQSLNNNPFNQSFGCRHSADTRELCERTRRKNTRSRMPFGSQANSRTQINQSKLRAREERMKKKTFVDSNKKFDGKLLKNQFEWIAITCLAHLININFI